VNKSFHGKLTSVRTNPKPTTLPMLAVFGDCGEPGASAEDSATQAPLHRTHQA
jgi:hypothetical protein